MSEISNKVKFHGFGTVSRFFDQENSLGILKIKLPLQSDNFFNEMSFWVAPALKKLASLVEGDFVKFTAINSNTQNSLYMTMESIEKIQQTEFVALEQAQSDEVAAYQKELSAKSASAQ